MNNIREIEPIADLSLFIDRLQKEDKRLEQIYKMLKIAYIVLIIVYIPIFYSEFMKGGTISIVKISSIFLGFITFLVYSGYMQKTLDYSIPTLKLLRNTVKRYRPFSMRDVVGILGFSSLMFGLIINEKRYLAYQEFLKSGKSFGASINDFWSGLKQFKINSIAEFTNEHEFMILSVLIAIAILLLLVSILTGYVIWKIRYKPIRNNALTLIRELEY